MTHSHRFTLPRDEFARRPGDENDSLARTHGPDWRRVLQIRDNPYADHDESAFCALFEDYLPAAALEPWGMGK